MTPLLPNARYEKKFVIHGRTVSEVRALIRAHPAAFREVYPARVVNNVYLDSPGLGDYYDHLNGASKRLKTRIRWYGETNGQIAAPVLERKMKCGSVSGKVSARLPAVVLNGHGLGGALKDALAKAKPNEHTLAAQLLTPSLHNRYSRHYFASADGRFRLTLDSDLAFEPGSAGAFAPRMRLPSVIVLELKFAPELAREAESVTKFFPFRVARCSKYVLGIEQTG